MHSISLNSVQFKFSNLIISCPLQKINRRELLTGETDTERLTIDVSGSPLLSHGRYYDFGAANEIQYTIVDVHCPLFYDMVLNEQEQHVIRYSHYSAMPEVAELAAIFDAEYARRAVTNMGDRLLICWDERIVFFYADWILTEDQLATIADILKP